MKLPRRNFLHRAGASLSLPAGAPRCWFSGRRHERHPRSPLSDGPGATCGPQHFHTSKAVYSLTRRSQRHFYGSFTSVVQKTALTATVDQAYKFKREATPARINGNAGWVAIILLSDRF